MTGRRAPARTGATHHTSTRDEVSSMNEWTVYVEVEGPGDVDFLSALADAFPREYGAAVGAGSGSITATMAVQQPDLMDAIRDGVTTLLRAADTAGVTVGRTVRAEAMTADLADRELEQRPVELGGLQEVAAALGVSKQRISELRVRPGFPAPLAQLASGPVWDMAQLSAFAATWQRRPGRPRTVTADAALS
jgi:hypothetical protein